MAYRDEVLADEPVLYWEMSDTSGTPVNSGSGSYSLALGTGVTRGAAGIKGTNGYTFNGTNAAYAQANVPATVYSDRVFSVDIWVKGTVKDKVFVRIAGTTHYVELSAVATTGYARALISGSATIAMNSTVNVTDGQWHHIALVMDGALSRSFYVDGVLVATDTTALTTLTIGGSLTYAGANTNFAWNGTLDEFAVYDHALTTTRVQRHAVVGGPGTNITIDAATATTSTAGYTETVETTKNVNLTLATALTTTRGYDETALTQVAVDVTTATSSSNVYEPLIGTGISTNVSTATVSANGYTETIGTGVTVDPFTAIASAQGYTETVGTGLSIDTDTALSTADVIELSSVGGATILDVETATSTGQGISASVSTGVAVDVLMATASAQAYDTVIGSGESVVLETANFTSSTYDETVSTGTSFTLTTPTVDVRGLTETVSTGISHNTVTTPTSARAYDVTVTYGTGANVATALTTGQVLGEPVIGTGTTVDVTTATSSAQAISTGTATGITVSLPTPTASASAYEASVVLPLHREVQVGTATASAVTTEPTILTFATENLSVSKDVSIFNDAPNSNFNSDVARIQKSSSETPANSDLYLFDFDNKTAYTTAKITVRISTAGSNPFTPVLYKITSAWNEATVTYNTRPTYTFVKNLPSVNASVVGSTVTFDVTDALVDNVHGFAIAANGDFHVAYFNTKEAATVAHRPVIAATKLVAYEQPVLDVATAKATAATYEPEIIAYADTTIDLATATSTIVSHEADAFQRKTATVYPSRDFYVRTADNQINDTTRIYVGRYTTSPDYWAVGILDFELPSEMTTSGLRSALLRINVEQYTGAGFQIRPITQQFGPQDTTFVLGDPMTITMLNTGTALIDVKNLINTDTFYGLHFSQSIYSANYMFSFSSMNSTTETLRPRLLLDYDVSAGVTVVDLDSPTVSQTSYDVAVETTWEPSVYVGVLTAGSTVRPSSTQYVSLPIVVDADSTDTVMLGAYDPEVEVKQGVFVELDTPRILVTHLGLTDVNGEPIAPQESEDEYFNSTMRTLGGAGYAIDKWMRMNERSGTIAYDRVSGEPLADIYDVTIGLNRAPDARHSFYFNGAASVNQREPSGQVPDEMFYGPGNLEFTFRTDKENQFIMGGADIKTGSEGIIGSTSFVGASEIIMVDGKIAFRAYTTPTRERAGGLLQTDIQGFKNLADNKWHHVHIQFGGSNPARGNAFMEIYVDGKLEVRRQQGTSGTYAPGQVASNPGNIYFGFPDFIGGRGNEIDGYQMPAITTADWFVGDMTEVVYRNDSLLNPDQIFLQRDNMFGIKPVYVPTVRATAKAETATAKGNQIRVLSIDFAPGNFGNSAARFSSPPKEGYRAKKLVGSEEPPSSWETRTGAPVWEYWPGSKLPGSTTEYFPGIVADAMVSPDVVTDKISGGIEGYQFFYTAARNNYLDPVTDNERVLDLEVDLEMDDYDVISIINFPQNDAAWEYFRGMDDYNTPPFTPGRAQAYGLIDQIKEQVVGGKRLFVNDPMSALALGIIDRVDFVPSMWEHFIDSPGLFSNVGYFDYWAALNDPVRNPRKLASVAMSLVGRYNDMHRNNKQRVVNVVEGLTDIPSWIITDSIEWINVDYMGGTSATQPPEVNLIRYEDRMAGLAPGDEFYMIGSGGPSMFDNAELTGASGREKWQVHRAEGWPAAPISAVKSGVVVTSFADTVINMNELQSNPYRDYAVSIVVRPGDSLGGSAPIAGKVYCNFTEAHTNWAPYQPYELVMKYPEGDTFTLGGMTIRLTDEMKHWNYNEYLGTWSGSEVLLPSVKSTWVTGAGGQRFKKNDVEMSANSTINRWSFRSFFPLEQIPVFPMAYRGWKWLVSDAAATGNAVASVATARLAAGAEDATITARRSVDVTVGTARTNTEAVNPQDVVAADVTVLTITPSFRIDVGAWNEDISLDTATATVQSYEMADSIWATADFLVMTLPTPELTLYLEEAND